ncbi:MULTISPECIES: class I SAM-dependent methyltransferase [Parvularcula]|uniref:class I SAM-dependent methyltransferase n=1 Tax=Parvularcula TaxID=208215 RepID=UPI00068B2979|nr:MULTISPECIES: class I SAM-dependent methyltransferase [Parvularcula]
MGILDAGQVQHLYDRRAGHYDALTLAFRALGFGRHQSRLVAELGLSEGATVVDLCCGTGVNLEELSSAVGSRGAVIGVDLSEGMLSEARERVRAAGLANVQLVQADVRDYQLPDEAAAVLSTFGLEMVPAYDEVIEGLAERLPVGGRVGLLGLKHPEGWPDWLVEAGVVATKPFGVSRDYEDFRPWTAADQHFDRRSFREHLLGAAYSYVGEKAQGLTSLGNGEP